MCKRILQFVFVFVFLVVQVNSFPPLRISNAQSASHCSLSLPFGRDAHKVGVLNVQRCQTFSLRKCIKKAHTSFATSVQVYEGEEDLPEFMKKKQPIILTGSNYPPPLCYNCKHYIHFTSLNNSTNAKFMESPWYKRYLSVSFRQDEFGTGLGLCKMFGNKLDLVRYSFAKHARENKDQCGKEGHLYEESYIGFHFLKEDDKHVDKHSEEKSKDFIVIPSTKEKEKEKEKDLEDLKNVNTQLYEYSIFLKKNENK